MASCCGIHLADRPILLSTWLKFRHDILGGHLLKHGDIVDMTLEEYVDRLHEADENWTPDDAFVDALRNSPEYCAPGNTIAVLSLDVFSSRAVTRR